MEIDGKHQDGLKTRPSSDLKANELPHCVKLTDMLDWLMFMSANLMINSWACHGMSVRLEDHRPTYIMS